MMSKHSGTERHSVKCVFSTQNYRVKATFYRVSLCALTHMAVSTMAPGSFYYDMYCDLYDQNALLEKQCINPMYSKATFNHEQESLNPCIGFLHMPIYLCYDHNQFSSRRAQPRSIKQ